MNINRTIQLIGLIIFLMLFIGCTSQNTPSMRPPNINYIVTSTNQPETQIERNIRVFQAIWASACRPLPTIPNVISFFGARYFVAMAPAAPVLISVNLVH
jgi:hypothetical protein